ncbi:MAG: hypothetical protein V7636_134 [Actinomycetota bacterium]
MATSSVLTASEARISVVIATLGRPERLARALKALLACDPLPYEIVVVDGSTDHSARAAVDAMSTTSAPILFVDSARGSAHQRNVGIDRSTGDVVLFVDDDADVEPDVIGIVRSAFTDPNVVGATGQILEPSAWRMGRKDSRVRRLLPGGGVDGQFNRFGYPRRVTDGTRDQDVEFMQGAFMAARRDLATSVRFDESMPGYALGEDEDFSYRLSHHGRLRHLAAAVVHHDNGGLLSRDRRAFGRLVVTRRAYLIRKNFHPTTGTWIAFAGLVAVLVGHRLLNRDLEGARGVIEGAIDVARGR